MAALKAGTGQAEVLQKPGVEVRNTNVQKEPLTMGWCLDCHNTQQVDLSKNAYYEEVHQRLVDHGEEELKKYLEDGKITVRELGGYECSKCHY